MFVILLRYTAPVDQVNAVRPAHVAWLQQHLAEGTLLVAGRRDSGDGGVLLARGSRAAVDAMVAGDPYVAGGVAAAEVIAFAPTLAAPGLEAPAA